MAKDKRVLLSLERNLIIQEHYRDEDSVSDRKKLPHSERLVGRNFFAYFTE